MSIDNCGVLVVGLKDFEIDEKVYEELEGEQIGVFSFGNVVGFHDTGIAGFAYISRSYKMDKMPDDFFEQIEKCKIRFAEIFNQYPDIFIGNLQW